MRHGILDSVNSGQYITATANASGIAQGFIGPVPAGYCWYVERMTTWSNTSATTGLELEIFVLTSGTLGSNYTTTVGDRAGRQDLSTNAQDDVADENSPIYVGEGYYLVALWTGFTSGDKVQLSAQIAVHLTDLTIQSPQTVKQETEPTPDLTPEAEVDAVETAQTADLLRSMDTVV